MTLPRTRAFLWKKTSLKLLDQRRLPQEIIWHSCRRWTDVAQAIRLMIVRGAPAIGCCAAYGLVLAAKSQSKGSFNKMRSTLEEAAKGLVNARPTAVNLRWAIERMRQVWATALPGDGATSALIRLLEKEAFVIEEEDRQSNRAMGELGAALIPDNATVLTHCNTGSLATAGLGTAFGVLWTAHRQGKIKKVLASETRPYLQGARLTAWELKQERIPFELITDNMAAHLMKTEAVHGIFVGADRIAANGDTANKIGTYSLAVLAAFHHVPFYVVAPLSTIDLSTPNGSAIPIEERSMEEVTTIGGKRMSPKGTLARHPAFDVTPAELITGIVTDRGIARPVYAESLPRLFDPSPKPSVPRAKEPAKPARGVPTLTII